MEAPFYRMSAMFLNLIEKLYGSLLIVWGLHMAISYNWKIVDQNLSVLFLKIYAWSAICYINRIGLGLYWKNY